MSDIERDEQQLDATVQKLRRYIYMLEKDNMRKKTPQSDSDMIDKIIRAIRSAVDEEGE